MGFQNVHVPFVPLEDAAEEIQLEVELRLFGQTGQGQYGGGLGVFAVHAALGIGTLGRRGRQDAVTALALVMLLAIGAVLLSRSSQYEPQIYALLFGVGNLLFGRYTAGAALMALSATLLAILFCEGFIS